MFKRLFGGRSDQTQAHELYGAVVAAARDRRFFRDLGIPDTLDGRFELLCVHIYLLTKRLQREGAEAKAVSQVLFDLFWDDMGAGLREGGVGDSVVPKRLTKMSKVFFGRVGAFDEALEKSDQLDPVITVFERNLGEMTGARSPDCQAMGRYVLMQRQFLDGQDWRRLGTEIDPFDVDALPTLVGQRKSETAA